MQEETNGIIHAVTIDLPNRLRITGAYVSPNTSTTAFTNCLSSVIMNGSGRDWLIGE